MADEKRYYELTVIPDVDVEDDMLIPIDRDDFAETQVTAVSGVVYAEKTRAEAAEAAIITGAGLETDGSYDADDTTNYTRPVDFAAAALDESLKNADILLDAVIKELYDNETCSSITLTPAQILGCDSTAVSFISSPGAGNVIVPRLFYGWITFATTQYASASGIKLRYATSGVNIATIAASFVTKGATTYFIGLIADNIEMSVNSAIEVYAFNPITLGDSSISITLCYKLVDVAAAGTVASATCCVDSYTTTFTDADLTAGWIEFNHGLGTKSVIYSIIGLDESGDEIFIDSPAKPGKKTGLFSDKTEYLSFYFDTLSPGTYTITIMAKI